jgi:hypothetical protein
MMFGQVLYCIDTLVGQRKLNDGGTVNRMTNIYYMQIYSIILLHFLSLSGEVGMLPLLPIPTEMEL